MKGILDDIFFIRRPAVGCPQLLAGQINELPVVPLPERLRSGRIAVFERRNPVRDRAVRRHGCLAEPRTRDLTIADALYCFWFEWPCIDRCRGTVLRATGM